MSWHVEQFRQAVNKGHYDQERARGGRVAVSVGHAAAAKLIHYDVLGIGDTRPDLLDRPAFIGKRLWVAQSIGALIADRPAEMTIVSSEVEHDRLYQGLAFGKAGDKPLFTIWRTLRPMMPDETVNQYQQALLWARRPGSNPEIHSELVLPKHIQAQIETAVPLLPAEAK